MIEQSIKNLKQYIKEDVVYNLYKQKKQKEFNDFEMFCIEHCKDIEILIKEYCKLKKERKIK